MKLMVLLLLLSIGNPCKADDNTWTKTDIGLQIAQEALIITDWRQTSWLHVGGYLETNPIMGKRPSQATINQYFVTLALGHYIITNHLTGSNRRAWQIATLTVGAYFVANNVHIGVKLTW